jgi:hypothetical protein
LARSRRSSASKFSAASLVAFTAAWFYAKITPAALHCGDFDYRRRKDAEALGEIPEFALSDYRRKVAGPAPPAARTS